MSDAAQDYEVEVSAATFDKLVRIAWMLDCTPAAALEEVIREFKFEEIGVTDGGA